MTLFMLQGKRGQELLHQQVVAINKIIQQVDSGAEILPMHVHDCVYIKCSSVEQAQEIMRRIRELEGAVEDV